MRNPKIDYKWWTLDCEGCHCQIDGVCLWGVRDKVLTKAYSDGREHKPKHCEYLGKPPMRSEIVKHESRFMGGELGEPRYVIGRQLELFK